MVRPSLENSLDIKETWSSGFVCQNLAEPLTGPCHVTIPPDVRKDRGKKTLLAGATD